MCSPEEKPHHISFDISQLCMKLHLYQTYHNYVAKNQIAYISITAFQTESEKRDLDQKWQLDLVMMLTGGPNWAFILPCIFWLMAIVMRIVNSKHIVLLKGVNITKQELRQSLKNCNFTLLTIARTLALILSPFYLGLCWFETDLFYTTHVGALTIFLVWLNVTFTLGKGESELG